MEGRWPANGNSHERPSHRAQDRERLQQALGRIRQVAQRDKDMRFTTLWHHVYDRERLREAFLSLKRTAAPGVDGETWAAYAENLEANLEDLSSRLQRGAYRAKPARRVYLPKPDGRQRPIGIPVLEDKIVQRATVEVLNAVYETDFLKYSYGFRPGRRPHDALDALAVGIQTREVNWVLDADIRGFFDAIDHGWLMRFVEHRIADRRVLRHIQKWLNAGVLEDGKWCRVDEGTPQGGTISPLLANIYLHYAFDLWVQSWGQRQARGQIVVVRYADDFIVGFQHLEDAQRFLRELRERLAKFRLELHPDKTRLIEFGRCAARDRRRRGERKPETFDFLGFTHYCGQTLRGEFKVKRRTIHKRLARKISELKNALRQRLHWCIPEVGRWLASVLRGHYQYYGVPFNYDALACLYRALVRLWYRTLRRRSQRTKVTWARVERLAKRWLPRPRILHPYPEQRLTVRPAARAG
ncbi:MAG: group II intron reverse transcriptase/maturase [Planctomycetota bacterium]